jgi:hypothetical protein
MMIRTLSGLASSAPHTASVTMAIRRRFFSASRPSSISICTIGIAHLTSGTADRSGPVGALT